MALEAALLALIWPALAFAGTIPDVGATWEQVQKGDIRVECTTHEGLPWCRAWSQTETALDHVAAAIEDRASFPKYFAHVGETRLLDTYTFYMRIDLPSPLYDRDQVTRAERRDEDGVRIYEWHSVDHPDVPVDECCVRLADAAGEWRLWPQEDGSTKIRYTWVSTMGGGFPSWLLGRAALSHADETVKGTIAAAKAQSGG